MKLEHQEVVEEVQDWEQAACEKAKERKSELALAQKQMEHLWKKEADIEAGRQDADGKIKSVKVCNKSYQHWPKS